MKRKQGALDRAADRIMGVDSPAYGDERERAVVLEASTFGLTLGMCLSLGAALVAAVLGHVLLPGVLLAVMLLPNLSTAWYAQRRGVDIAELAERRVRARTNDVRGTMIFAGMFLARSKDVLGSMVFTGMFLTFAAMAYTLFVGHGLVPAPEVDVTGPDASGFGAGLMRGAVIGGMAGLLVAAAVTELSSRRARKPAAETDGTDDLDD